MCWFIECWENRLRSYSNRLYDVMRIALIVIDARHYYIKNQHVYLLVLFLLELLSARISSSCVEK